MPIYEQTPIRLKVNLVGPPPVYPIDQNTGQAPQFWRCATVGIAVGIFDAAGDPVDLTNLAETGKLQLMLFKDQLSLVPLWTKEVAGPDLIPTISVDGWENGTQQQAVFSLTKAETDQALGGGVQANFWMVLNGITDDGDGILYAAGPCTIYNAALSLPVASNSSPSFHEQTLDVGNANVVPTSNFHKEVINLGGAARTSNVIVGITGLLAGAEVEVLILAPGAAAAIDVQFFVGSLAGANPFAFNTSGGTTRALFRFWFNGATLIPIEQVNPPY